WTERLDLAPRHPRRAGGREDAEVAHGGRRRELVDQDVALGRVPREGVQQGGGRAGRAAVHLVDGVAVRVLRHGQAHAAEVVLRAEVDLDPLRRVETRPPLRPAAVDGVLGRPPGSSLDAVTPLPNARFGFGTVTLAHGSGWSVGASASPSTVPFEPHRPGPSISSPSQCQVSQPSYPRTQEAVCQFTSSCAATWIAG